MATLKNFMDRIKTVYATANSSYSAKVKRLRALRDELGAIGSDRNLTIHGKQAKRDALRAEETAIKKDLEVIARDAKATAAIIRSEVERDFKGLYAASTDSLDMKTLELLKTGILTDEEMIDLAKKHEFNAATRRLIGKYAHERPSSAMRALAATCEKASMRPDLDAVDSLIATANYTVGDAPLSGQYGAVELGKKLDKITDYAYQIAPNIECGRDSNGVMYYRANNTTVNVENE